MSDTPSSENKLSSSKATSQFEEQLLRIFEVTGLRTQSELANFIGIRQSGISLAKSRKSVPSDWLIKLLELKGINPFWVRSGEGSKLVFTEESVTGMKKMYFSDIPGKKVQDCSTYELLAEVLHRVRHNLV